VVDPEIGRLLNEQGPLIPFDPPWVTVCRDVSSCEEASAARDGFKAVR
jgi:hypothetical protein